MSKQESLSRREILRSSVGLGALGLGGLGAYRALAQAKKPGIPAQPKSAVVPSGACTLTPQTTEGPFYLNTQLLRQDITEGCPGLPLILDVQIVSLSNCTPIQGAIVDIWHCDHDGIYSGFQGQLNNRNATGENFMRGVQVTDSGGNVTFHTNYPGWYPGRAVHIHFTIWLQNNRRVTSQWYFDDAVTDEAYGISEPYRRRPGNRTRNNRDLIYTPQTLLKLTPLPGAYRAAFQVAIA